MSEHLIRAARNRHETAIRKSEEALRDLAARGQPITFAAVARQAGVSTDFLYHHPALRSKITSMRGHVSRALVVEQDNPDATSAAVRALSARLKDMNRRHREEVHALQRDLAASQGENLLLRRRLAAYEHVVS